MIELAAGPWRAVLRPEIGGCLAALSRDDVPILRSMPDTASDVLQSACFPLVPYCNRIAEGRFTFAGQAGRIGGNLPGQRHPLHGTGWRRAWRVLRCSGSSAVIEDDCPAGEWPWATSARQTVMLDETGCTISLIGENRASTPAPLGLGLHPYFRRSATSSVTFQASAMLGIDEEFLPDGTVHPAGTFAPWSVGARLPSSLVDHCFTGWSGKATIVDAEGTIGISALGTPYCHLYAPPGGAELCLEPVAHPPDAINRDPASMPLVLPGLASAIVLRIEATPPAG